MIQAVEAPATTQLEGLMAGQAAAWNRHDMASFASLFTEDAEFVNVVGMHWRGRPEIEAMHVKLHETIFRDSQIRQVSSTVKFLRPDVAIGQFSWEMTGAHALDNWKVPEVRRTLMTVVFVPAETSQHGWKIAALHNTEVMQVSMKDVEGH